MSKSETDNKVPEKHNSDNKKKAACYGGSLLLKEGNWGLKIFTAY